MRFVASHQDGFVEYVQWTSVNYRSVLLSKRLVSTSELTNPARHGLEHNA
jgi:hypothetical protein